MKPIRHKDVPWAPAYLVNHDPHDKGAMDVYPMISLEAAQAEADRRQKWLDDNGYEDGGVWRAYVKLPRIRISLLYGWDHKLSEPRR